MIVLTLGGPTARPNVNAAELVCGHLRTYSFRLQPKPLRRAFFSQERTMRVFNLVLTSVVAFNALLFVTLYLRRPRPELRTRLFRWVLHGGVGRRSRARGHSHIPT
jgi:hypothetical protein